MGYVRLASYMVLVSSIAITVGTARAQELGSADGAASDEEIIVTANRREQSLSDVGLSIAVIGGEELATRNIVSTADLSNVVPGFAVGESGFGTPLYSLRGIGVNEQSLAVNSSVAIYVDEVPLPFPVMSQGATLDVQRLEVLKGPQGTLYGQNATAGAINYIANKPTDEFSAGATGSFGRFSTASGEVFLSGPISSSLKGRMAMRVIRSGPWQKSITRDDEFGRTRKFVGRAMLEWEPSSDFKISLIGSAWTDDSDTVLPQLTAVVPRSAAAALIIPPAALNAPISPNKPRLTDWTADEEDFYRFNDHFYQGALRADWHLSDEVTLTSISAYSKMRRDAGFSQDGMAARAQYFTQEGGIRSFNHEMRLSASFSGITLVVGGNYQKARVRELLTNYSPDSGQPSVAGIRYDGLAVRAKQDIRHIAVFGNIDAELTEQLSLTAGIRLSEEKRSTESCSADKGDGRGGLAFTTFFNIGRPGNGLPVLPLIPAGGCISLNEQGIPALFEGSLTEDNVPWNVGLNWKPTADALIYARVSQGYKSGNYAALPGANNAVYKPVVQEDLLAYEIGTRFTLGSLARFEFAAFKYDYVNKQQRGRIVVPVLGNVNAQLNIPKSKAKGLEAAISLRPAKGLTINGSWLYFDSEIVNFTGTNVAGQLVDFAGEPLSFTPKNSGNFDAAYEFAVSNDVDAFIGGDIAYRGKTVAQLAAPSDFDLPAYTLVGAQAGIKSHDGRWRVWLWGKNITDKYYVTNANRGGDVNVRWPGMPATYGISASFRY